MLFVVDKDTDDVLFKVDAWDREAFKKADDFIESNGFAFLYDHLTCIGNMVWYVTKED